LSLTVVDLFKPAEDNSVRWKIAVVSKGEPWTTEIVTELNYPATPATRFWTAWSDPVWSTQSDPDKQTSVTHLLDKLQVDDADRSNLQCLRD